MIPLFKVFMADDAIDYVSETLHSGYLGQGPKVDKFEKALSTWFGSDKVVALNSGTSAIRLALRLAGVGHGDQVISTPMTCTATNSPILEQGASPIWADINPATGNMDPDDVKKKITKRTKAILCVHWAGYPCDLGELHDVAFQQGIPVIEDAAHAFNASYEGKPIGSHSRFVCFSFQAIKHLTTGDGGALVCQFKDDYDRARLLRWYGIDRKSTSKDLRCEEDIREYGYKYHMNDVAASIGLANLSHVGLIVAAHLSNGQKFRECIKSWGSKRVKLLDYKSDRLSAFWIFTLLVDDRESFREFMKANGVMTSQVHTRNDLHTVFKKSRAKLPGLEEFAAHQVAIPVGWWLKDEDRDRILYNVQQWGKA